MCFRSNFQPFFIFTQNLHLGVDGSTIFDVHCTILLLRIFASLNHPGVVI